MFLCFLDIVYLKQYIRMCPVSPVILLGVYVSQKPNNCVYVFYTNININNHKYYYLYPPPLMYVDLHLASLRLQVRVLPRRLAGEGEVRGRLQFPVLPRAAEDVAVGELEDAPALLAAVRELPVVARAVQLADELPAPVPLVVQPLALVPVAVLVGEHAEPARAVVQPLAAEPVAVSVDQLALTVLLGVDLSKLKLMCDV